MLIYLLTPGQHLIIMNLILARSLDSGWGFGFTLLILPYNAFRFEYAFNEYNEGEFILETGFSF